MKKTTITSFVKILLVLALVCVLGTTETVLAESGPTLNDYTIGIVKGKTFTLKLEYGGTAASFASKNTSIATVNSKGVVKGVKPGVTSIIVTDTKGQIYEAEVTVISKADAKKKVTASAVVKDFNPKDSYTVDYTYYPNGEIQSLYAYDDNYNVLFASASSYDKAKNVETVLLYGKDNVYVGKQLIYHDGYFGQVTLSQTFDEDDQLIYYSEITVVTEDDAKTEITKTYDKNKKGKFKNTYTTEETETPDSICTKNYENGVLVREFNQYYDDDGTPSYFEEYDGEGNVLTNSDFCIDNNYYTFENFDNKGNIVYTSTGWISLEPGQSKYGLSAYASFRPDDSFGHGHVVYMVDMDFNKDNDRIRDVYYYRDHDTDEPIFYVTTYKVMTLKKYFETLY